QNVQTLEFWACPAYLKQLPELLGALVERARAGSAEILQAYVADVDTEKRALLEGAGFREEARLHERLREGDDARDLLIYSRSFDRRSPKAHPVSNYYGSRQAFRTDSK